jgi:hypothetical protein
MTKYKTALAFGSLVLPEKYSFDDNTVSKSWSAAINRVNKFNFFPCHFPSSRALSITYFKGPSLTTRTKTIKVRREHC